MARREVLQLDSEFLAQLPPRARLAPTPLVRPNVAQLRFALPRSAPASVGAYAANGSLVRRILSGELAAGEHDCGWDGCDELGVPVAAGVYLVRLEVDGRIVTSRRVNIG